ncbi:hypothetical protein DM01DRAFT_1117295 [Hesseltinella vesiculosa]|uniref:Uncharacterized protein n=1 Tax=Hesseltinella vesiculosa TaxID=101127 RepID=A0A1X2G9I5_9FUNG|nr:hypothetical protein DM01DRAFT_1117295 [Hesseltinella vesiculosa]
MKHQHHRHASTSSSNVLSKDYYPLHRSVTDDHEERQIKHHDKKSPLTRFVTKLLGLPVSHHHHRHHRHHHHHGSHRRGKSNSTTSITLSSVFHFHHHEKQPPQEPSSADDSCSSVSSDASDDLGTVNSSTVMSSTATHHQPLDSFLLADSQPSTPTLETRGLATDSPLASPAMDALVNASQLPARQSTIQFVTSDFDHLAPIQLAHPSTHVLLTPSLAEQVHFFAFYGSKENKETFGDQSRRSRGSQFFFSA